jgi:hypothetical protein
MLIPVSCTLPIYIGSGSHGNRRRSAYDLISRRPGIGRSGDLGALECGSVGAGGHHAFHHHRFRPDRRACVERPEPRPGHAIAIGGTETAAARPRRSSPAAPERHCAQHAQPDRIEYAIGCAGSRYNGAKHPRSGWAVGARPEEHLSRLLTVVRRQIKRTPVGRDRGPLRRTPGEGGEMSSGILSTSERRREFPGRGKKPKTVLRLWSHGARQAAGSPLFELDCAIDFER